MSTVVYDLPNPERLVIATVGPPGQRTFLLQAREGRQLLTLKLEKGHVAELSRRLIDLLADLPIAVGTDVDASTLETPFEADFVVGGLSLTWDEVAERFVLVAEELVLVDVDDDDDLDDDEDDEMPTGAVARIGASPDQLAALAQAGEALVAAGREPCPLCGLPLDPRGHVCPRSNGHGPPIR
jgi:uncharacterized repeat protein (TIGR03847 family)